MSDLEIWATIGALVLATALTRSSFWLVGHHLTIPPRIQAMLRFAPACALAAIVGPDILIDTGGQLHLSLGNPRLVAGGAAVLFYLVRRNMLHTIIFGMAAFTLLRILHLST